MKKVALLLAICYAFASCEKEPLPMLNPLIQEVPKKTSPPVQQPTTVNTHTHYEMSNAVQCSSLTLQSQRCQNRTKNSCGHCWQHH